MLVFSYVVLTLILSGLYFFLLTYIIDSWSTIAVNYDILDKSTTLKFSILIPARNEADNIGRCLDSILHSYSRTQLDLEIIVIDDHSTDETATIVSQYADHGIQLLQLKDAITANTKINAYKKAALSHGLQQATGQYIIQLDADVWLPEHYLETIAIAAQHSGADFIAAPVIFIPDGSILGQFQCLDMLGMMNITGAGISQKTWYMANGANMIYKKSLVSYPSAGTGLASGDDIFTIQNLAQKPDSHIIYLKAADASVYTNTEKTFSKFWSQRIRWTTKNRSMKNKKMIAMMAIPYLSSLWLFAHIIGWIFLGPLVIVIAMVHILSMMSIDYIFLKTPADYYKQDKSLKYFLTSFFLHKLYLAVIGTVGLVVTEYKWKGRKVR